MRKHVPHLGAEMRPAEALILIGADPPPYQELEGLMQELGNWTSEDLHSYSTLTPFG